MTFTVKDFLELPLLRDAQLVAGSGGLGRDVCWPAVIEWPVEDFVRPGEICLMSGIGCDEHMLHDVVREVIESGAAGLCLGVGAGRYFEEIPKAIAAFADKRSFPLIQLPWELRFGDLTLAIADRTLVERYRGHGRAQGVARAFLDLVLQGRGYQGIAEELDSLLGREVVILNLDLQPQARSRDASNGQAAVDGSKTEQDTVGDAELAAFAHELAGARLRPVGEMPRLGLAAGFAVPVLSDRAAVAYVHIAGKEGGGRLLSVEKQAIEDASLAVAVEASRQRAAAEAEARARGHFLWTLALDPTERLGEIAAKARLLGYDLRTRYHVMLLEVTPRSHQQSGDAVNPALDAALQVLNRLAAASRLRLTAAPDERRILVVIEATAGVDVLRSMAENLCADLEATRVEVLCVLAAEPSPLANLATAYVEVLRTLEVRQALGGSGCLVDTDEFRPFLLLRKLAADPEALATARKVVGPLVEYDRGTSRDFLHTLEVYLDENGNRSSTARRLYLNRHSLLYRLRRIEELTNCSLGSHRDLVLLDLSLRLLRLSEGANETS